MFLVWYFACVSCCYILAVMTCDLCFLGFCLFFGCQGQISMNNVMKIECIFNSTILTWAQACDGTPTGARSILLELNTCKIGSYGLRLTKRLQVEAREAEGQPMSPDVHICSQDPTIPYRTVLSIGALPNPSHLATSDNPNPKPQTSSCRMLFSMSVCFSPSSAGVDAVSKRAALSCISQSST